MSMTIDFSDEVQVKISMIDYVKGLMQDLPDDMKSLAMTPSVYHLFDFNSDAKKFIPEYMMFFHIQIARLMLLSKRDVPDIQTAVVFLFKMVKGPDVDYYNKLSHVMKYLSDTWKLHFFY